MKFKVDVQGFKMSDNEFAVEELSMFLCAGNLYIYT